MTKTVEELKVDHYLIFYNGHSYFELKLHDQIIGNMTLVDEKNVGQMGNVQIGDRKWSFKPSNSFWPKKFLIMDEVGNNETSIKFGVLGFSAHLNFNGTGYVFRAGGGRVRTSHSWEWISSPNIARYLYVTSRGQYPDGVSVVRVDEVLKDSDLLVLIFLAKYLEVVYISGK